MVTGSTSGYILNLEIYAGEGKKLKETIFTLLEPYLDQNYHVYQDNYYNHVTIAETLLSRQESMWNNQSELGSSSRNEKRITVSETR